MTTAELRAYSNAKADGALRHSGSLPQPEIQQAVADAIAEAWQNGFTEGKIAVAASKGTP